MKFPFFCFYKSNDCCWFRIWGYGLLFASYDMLFSERNGLKKYWQITKKWRLRILKKD